MPVNLNLVLGGYILAVAVLAACFFRFARRRPLPASPVPPIAADFDSLFDREIGTAAAANAPLRRADRELLTKVNALGLSGTEDREPEMR